MIIKVQDDKQQDKFTTEAAHIRWVEAEGENYKILEIHIAATQSKAAGSVSLTNTRIEEKPSLRIRVFHGDRVFIMNNEGKTIDAKRIDLTEEEESD